MVKKTMDTLFRVRAFIGGIVAVVFLAIVGLYLIFGEGGAANSAVGVSLLMAAQQMVQSWQVNRSNQKQHESDRDWWQGQDFPAKKHWLPPEPPERGYET